MHARRLDPVSFALLLAATWAGAAPAMAGQLREVVTQARPLEQSDSGAARWRVAGVALPAYGDISLIVEEFDLLTPDLQFAVDGRDVPTPAFLRGIHLLRGRVDGEPASRVVLRHGGEELDGLLDLGGLRYQLTAERGILVAREEMTEEIDSDCSVLSGDVGELSVGAAAARRGPPPVPIPVKVYGAPVIVEAGYQHFLNSGSDLQRATDHLVGVFAEVATLLEDEVGIRLKLSRLSIWTVPDPWLTEGDGYWRTWYAEHPVQTHPRAFVILATGFYGGWAYLGGACTAYGATAFDTVVISGMDRTGVAHEVGHVLGSAHTHCYGYGEPESRGANGLPPVDRCHNQQPTCYDGPAIQQAGSVMGYCIGKRFSFGAPGLYGEQSERVPAVLRRFVEHAHGKYPHCLSALTDAVDLRVEKVVAGRATLAWNDPFPDETGWVLEQRRRNSWRAVGSLAANATRVELRGAAAKPGATYRLHARFQGNVSQPSIPVTLQQP